MFLNTVQSTSHIIKGTIFCEMINSYYEVSTKLVSMNWPHNELPLRHMILITLTCKPFVSISWRYPITKLENSDSAVYMTPHISALSCYTLYNMYKVPHKFFYLIIPVDQQETYQVFDSESEVCTVFSLLTLGWLIWSYFFKNLFWFFIWKQRTKCKV